MSGRYRINMTRTPKGHDVWWVIEPFGDNERHPHGSLAAAMTCATRLAQVLAMEIALRQDFGVEPKQVRG